MKPQKMPFKVFMEICSEVPRLTVNVIIKTPEGILLSKRDIPASQRNVAPTVTYGKKHKDSVKRFIRGRDER